jgi:GNAT superfamily N-acetyltransferase
VRKEAGVGDLGLRPATVDDAATIASHRARMFLEARGWPEERGADLLAALPEFLARAIGAGTYRGWLLTTPDGAVVAGAGVQVRGLIPRLEVLGGPEALVVNVYVEPAYRRRGLARRLMVAILDWCREEGIGRVVLHPTDAARPLYESLGFAASGEMILYP